jgi:hypothetical protein
MRLESGNREEIEFRMLAESSESAALDAFCEASHRGPPTRLVGLTAFSGSWRGSKLVPSKWRCLVPPTSR